LEEELSKVRRTRRGGLAERRLGWQGSRMQRERRRNRRSGWEPEKRRRQEGEEVEEKHMRQ
jgi:hypothetical protein